MPYIIRKKIIAYLRGSICNEMRFPRGLHVNITLWAQGSVYDLCFLLFTVLFYKVRLQSCFEGLSY